MVPNLFCLLEVKTNYIKLKTVALVIFKKFDLLQIVFYLKFCIVKFIELSEGKLTANDILVLPMDVTNISKHNSLFDNVISHFGKVRIILLNLNH